MYNLAFEKAVFSRQSFGAELPGAELFVAGALRWPCLAAPRAALCTHQSRGRRDASRNEEAFSIFGVQGGAPLQVFPPCGEAW